MIPSVSTSIGGQEMAGLLGRISKDLQGFVDLACSERTLAWLGQAKDWPPASA